MDKKLFTKNLKNWLEEFLIKKFSLTHDIVLITIPEVILSKMNNDLIKQMPNYSTWEFKPDIIAILKNKGTEQLELVILNRSITSLSLKELGEMHCYAKLTGAFIAIVASLNGVSSEVNILLLEDSIRERVLNYGEKETLIVLSWDKDNNQIDEDSIIPFEKKDFIVG